MGSRSITIWPLSAANLSRREAKLSARRKDRVVTVTQLSVTLLAVLSLAAESVAFMAFSEEDDRLPEVPL
jgi:hypothetical protein